MLTGAVEVYANHSFVIVGATAWPELDPGDGPAGADGRHVAIRTRGQVAHTRVSIWSRTMPLVGEVVFDGELDLDDYTICVSDIEELSRWTKRIEKTGPQRVVVRVDDPGYASRVHVGLGLDAGAQVRPVPSSGGPLLFNVLTSQPADFPGPNERGLVLDGHDSPHARLATAIMLLSGPDPAQPWLERHAVGGIVEWLRWLGITLDYARAEELGSQLRQLVHAARRAGPDSASAIPPQAAMHIATVILETIRQAPDAALGA